MGSGAMVSVNLNRLISGCLTRHMLPASYIYWSPFAMYVSYRTLSLRQRCALFLPRLTLNTLRRSTRSLLWKHHTEVCPYIIHPKFELGFWLLFFSLLYESEEGNTMIEEYHFCNFLWQKSARKIHRVFPIKCNILDRHNSAFSNRREFHKKVWKINRCSFLRNDFYYMTIAIFQLFILF